MEPAQADNRKGQWPTPDAACEANLIEYLNLPPLGGWDDVEATPLTKEGVKLELEANLHSRLLAHRETIGSFRALADVIDSGITPQQLTSLIERVSDTSGRFGNRATPLWGGPAAYRALFELVESAEQYIHIEMYILGGEVGHRLAEKLIEKAEAGIDVRVMFTASGLVISGGPSGTGFVSKLSGLRSHLFNDMYIRKRVIKRFAESKVRFLDAAPIARHWRRSAFKNQGISNRQDYYAWCDDNGLAKDWQSRQREMDKRCSSGIAHVDHRKMVIVDGKRAWVGSQNIADSYLYENELDESAKINRRKWQWHDISTLLEGPVARQLNEQFAERWALSGGDNFWAQGIDSDEPTFAGTDIITVAPTEPCDFDVSMKRNWRRLALSMLGFDMRPVTTGANATRDRFLDLPALAQQSFVAEHCYPSDSHLLSSWASHGQRLKDFTLIVPKYYDTRVLGRECMRFYAEMLEAGVNIQRYRQAIMHTKVAVVDKWYTSIGSYNLTFRSARADLELQFFVQSAAYGRAICENLQRDIELSEPAKPSWWNRLRGKFSVPIFDATVRYLIL